MKRIEICGNIASGKTTLCGHLAHKGFITIFENFQDNPFLQKFYDDPPKFSFETEITFLLLHYNAIKMSSQKRLYAYDFSFFQDIAYADVNLEGNRHKLFLELINELNSEISFPSKVIHLVCPEDELIKRIKARKRDVEDAITIDYLKEINKAIQFRVTEISDKIPVAHINSKEINFVENLNNIKSNDISI
jgi:deoxyadenosine/deoxycytidine kinase